MCCFGVFVAAIVAAALVAASAVVVAAAAAVFTTSTVQLNSQGVSTLRDLQNKPRKRVLHKIYAQPPMERSEQGARLCLTLNPTPCTTKNPSRTQKINPGTSLPPAFSSICEQNRDPIRWTQGWS